MRVDRLSLLSVGILMVWLLLYVLNVMLGLGEGYSTFFLPLSLATLLVVQLRSERPPFDLAIVFLISCLFFFCIGLILWPFSSVPPTEFASLVITTFTLAEFDNASLLTGISITLTMLAMSSFRAVPSYRMPRVFTPDADTRAQRLYRLGLMFMVLSMPGVVFELWLQFRYIQGAGYLALYVEGVPTSAWASFFYSFYTGFGLALTFAPSRRAFLGPAALYLIMATLDSLKGARGAVIVPLLFITWYYCSRFDVKVRLGSLARNMGVLMALFVFLTYQRDSELFSASIGQFLVDALSTQGRSLQLTVLFQQNANEIARYGNNMVLSNVLIPIIAILHPEVREAAQSMDQVLYSNNLKHILTYVLNPDYYFAGGGTGGERIPSGNQATQGQPLAVLAQARKIPAPLEAQGAPQTQTERWRGVHEEKWLRPASAVSGPRGGGWPAWPCRSCWNYGSETRAGACGGFSTVDTGVS